jgi:dTDP-4-dehydrorhamnose reductase
MKIMITGAYGQLGRCLQDVLAGLEHEVIAVGRKELDIASAEEVLHFVECHKPQVIINAAAYTAVDKAEVEPDLAFAINAGGVANLVSAANAVGAFLIHVSTDYVFDGSSRRPYVETDLLNPLGVYGKSKLAGESEAERARRYVTVRTAWVFSEYGSNFLKTMVKLGWERDSLSIVNDQIGAPTYAGDLASALVRLALCQPDNGVYHYSGGEPCSWFDFAREIFDACGDIVDGYRVPAITPIPTFEFPTPAKRPAYSVLDGTLLEVNLGIRTSDWRGALKDVCVKVLEDTARD